jgi:hypothetical protein
MPLAFAVSAIYVIHACIALNCSAFSWQFCQLAETVLVAVESAGPVVDASAARAGLSNLSAAAATCKRTKLRLVVQAASA